jgi:hypothetical protein
MQKNKNGMGKAILGTLPGKVQLNFKIESFFKNETMFMNVNEKMRPVETIPGMLGGIKKNDGRGEFNCVIL